MTTTPRTRPARRLSAALALAVGVALAALPAQQAAAASYVPINGEGSSWAGEALAQWASTVHSMGVTVSYTASGSSTGRGKFAQGIDAQFAVSEIPYTGDTADPQDLTRPRFGYNMMPVVSGGTAVMYNLKIGGNRFTDLKLSQPTIAGIFTGQITQWNDPAIAADNPGVALPAQRITVVVRSEGSGATAQFTLWLLRQFPQLWAKLCRTTGCDPAHATSYYPHNNLSNFIAQNGSVGVTNYVANTPYTINYDEYAYALKIGFPVAKVKNAAGYYTVPDQYAVAVAMTQARVNLDKGSPDYLSQDLSAVYAYGDPRSYPLSMYTYQLAPTQLHDGEFFTERQGATLGFFDQYVLCEGQRDMGALGYSPLPMNLVLAANEQVLQVPGVDADTTAKIAATGQAVASGSGNPCNNPTFKPGDSPSVNQLVKTAPFPDGCDAACRAPWTGGGSNQGPGGNDEPGGGGDPGPNPGGGDQGPDDPGGGDGPGPDDPGGDATPLADGATGVLPGGTYAVSFGAGTFTANGAVEVVLRSDPVTLAEGRAGADGSLSYRVTLPADLGAGAHTLTFTDTSDASRVQVVSFTVGDGAPADEDQVCDPDTGVCTGGATGTDVVTASNVSAVPAVIAGQSGWAGPQTLLVLIGLALLVGLFVPAVVARGMATRRADAGRRR